MKSPRYPKKFDSNCNISTFFGHSINIYGSEIVRNPSLCKIQSHPSAANLSPGNFELSLAKTDFSKESSRSISSRGLNNWLLTSCPPHLTNLVSFNAAITVFSNYKSS